MALRADDVDLERDSALVRRFQAGDDRAFDELYLRYHDRLERFCAKRVGNCHTAEEITQEAFTRALGALPDLRGELRFYPWVSVIASRLCVDSHRRQARSEPSPDPDPGSVSGGQDAIIDAVDSSLVTIAMGRLTPRHQDVLHLREVEGWSYQHIADHYGVTRGSVETLLFRARRALRREFRTVDGAGLAAVPVLGRVIQLAARARDRIPTWAPSVPAPAAVVAAATAGAAAVALAVIPARVPPTVRVTAPITAAPAALPLRTRSTAPTSTAPVVPATGATPAAPAVDDVVATIGSAATGLSPAAARAASDPALGSVPAGSTLDPDDPSTTTTTIAAGPGGPANHASSALVAPVVGTGTDVVGGVLPTVAAVTSVPPTVTGAVQGATATVTCVVSALPLGLAPPCTPPTTVP